MSSIHANGQPSDTAEFFDSPGSDTFYAYSDYGTTGQPAAGMYGSYGGGFANSASGFGTNVGYSTNGGSDTAYFYDSQGNATYYAYADYGASGKPSAGMYGSYADFGAYGNAAIGFATNIGYATKAGSDISYLFASPGNDTYYAYADYNNSGAGGGDVWQLRGLRLVCQRGQRLRHQRRLLHRGRQRHGLSLRFAGRRHVLCLRRLRQ